MLMLGGRALDCAIERAIIRGVRRALLYTMAVMMGRIRLYEDWPTQSPSHDSLALATARMSAKARHVLYKKGAPKLDDTHSTTI